MAFDPAQFWTDYETGNPKLTKRLITMAEKLFEVTLPPTYLALLKLRNGGETFAFSHPMKRKTACYAKRIPFHTMNGIAPKLAGTGYSITDLAFRLDAERQVILSGDGHNWVTLDYRKNKIPSVAWIAPQYDEDVQIAPTFDKFLTGLVR